ncbi:unnamed protein product, partial [Mesorhabditis belari]|uniref:Uncharacterized protein n=1 Tax=Mesorhabditis belari TaxID=2138241 RepID=A0AAF3FQ83_9BILA
MTFSFLEIIGARSRNFAEHHVLAVGGGQPTDRSLPGPTTSFSLSDPRPAPQLGFAQFSQIKLEVRSSTLSPWNVLGLVIIAFLLAFVCLVLIGAFVRTRWKRRQFEEIINFSQSIFVMFIQPNTPKVYPQTTIAAYQAFLVDTTFDLRRVSPPSTSFPLLRNSLSRDGWEEWAFGGWWIFTLFALLLFAFTSICLCVLAISFHRRINFPDEMLSQLLTNPRNEQPNERQPLYSSNHMRELDRRRKIFSQRLRYCTF